MKKIIPLFFLLALIIRLYTGTYIHDEFGYTHFFIKHRPIWKWTFNSPLGMSDLTLDDLPLSKRKEAILFKEFITDRGLSR